MLEGNYVRNVGEARNRISGKDTRTVEATTTRWRYQFDADRDPLPGGPLPDDADRDPLPGAPATRHYRP